MHKKLEADLISLAHSILQMKNRDDVFALEKKAKVVSSKLSMLAFVETYVNTTPNLEETREVLLSEVEKAFEKKELQVGIEEDVPDLSVIEKPIDTLVSESDESIEPLMVDAVVEVVNETIVSDLLIENTEDEGVIEQPFDELEATLFSKELPIIELEEEVQEESETVTEIKTATLEEELKDTIPVDVMANLFEMAKPTSLNDALTKNIQIGLNDRIAFVKNLFDGSQEDFNRVVSQLNSFKTEKEAIKFINKVVKPDYNWTNQEDFETRFLQIIQRKFV